MFFELICLFSALMDIIICIPSSNYFNSNSRSTRMPSFVSNGHVSTRIFQNALPLQNLLDNKLLQNSVQDSQASYSSLDSSVPSIGKSSSASSSPIFTKIFQNEQLLQQLKADEAIAENASQRREKRGIVLIDEDFNVPPEPGVKQGWGDGNLEKNATKSDKKNIEMMSTEEGSGQMEGFSTGTSHNMTPEQQQMSTDKFKVTPTKEYDKMISTSKHTNEPKSTSEHADRMISTSKHTNEPTSTSEHADKETSFKEYTDKMTSTTEDIEGSGEISVQFTHPSYTTEEPEEQDEKSPFKVCLKRTCNSNDLLLSPGITRKVPEGTNLTLSCSSVNSSEHGFLKLYKYNDSDSPLLQESNKEENLNFDIPLSQRHHSGTYMCLKFTEESCCHQQLDITVYEVPNYKTHLIVVGLIAAISLFTCILLGIYRSFKTKNYEVQMELQNMEKPVLF